jgi:hypothetical protein
LSDDQQLEVIVEDDGPGFESESVAEWRAEDSARTEWCDHSAIAEDVEIGPRERSRARRIRFTRSLR